MALRARFSGDNYLNGKVENQCLHELILTAAELSTDEFTERIRAAVERMELRSNRALCENRDLTEREKKLSSDDRDELEALRKAEAVREHRERVIAAIGEATDRDPRPETRAAFGEFVEALTRGIPHRVRIECRSVTSANAGARGAVAVEAIGRPQWLWQAAGIPFFPATGLTVSGPKFAALVTRSATAEGVAKPSMADPTLEQETLQAFAVVEEVSDQLVRFSIGAQAVSERLAAESVFSVNYAFAEALEAAAGTPVTYATSASHMADTGIATIWAATGAKPTALVVSPLDYASLADKAAVGPGDGIGAEVVRFNGTVLLVNSAITAGVGVVLNGAAFSAHGTDVLLASAPNLNTNMVTLRAETYAALLQHDAGAIVAVELAA